eukprot:6189366-Pleurochrysis_carterae.AAC.5
MQARTAAIGAACRRLACQCMSVAAHQCGSASLYKRTSTHEHPSLQDALVPPTTDEQKGPRRRYAVATSLKTHDRRG